MSLHYHRSSKSGSFSWFFMRISGLVLVLLVITHYVLMHINLDRGHTFKSVYEALTHPVWGPWWKTMDLTMLTLALWHGCTGVWGVVRDFDIPSWLRLTALGLLVVGGVAAGTMGYITVLSF